MNFQFEQYWKEYGDNELSHSETHYLLTIYSFLQKNDQLRASTIAKELSISRNAVHLQLKKLSEKKLVKIKDNFITLPMATVELVEKIANKRQTMIVLLSEVLGVPMHIATSDSCKVEHLISDETGEALLKFVQFLRSDRKVVLQFLKEYQKYYLQCDPEIGCGLCENIHSMEKIDEDE
ncbi:MAG: Mn-dependent DtxR family transcriptional regulator [Bacteriovoracaceae bacterium]